MYILIGTLVLSIHNQSHTSSFSVEFNTAEACNTAITQISNHTRHIDLDKSSLICLSKDTADYVNVEKQDELSVLESEL